MSCCSGLFLFSRKNQLFQKSSKKWLIINAYEIKTNLSRAKLSHLMDSETWMNASKAIELGFADDMLTDEKKTETDEMPA